MYREEPYKDTVIKITCVVKVASLNINEQNLSISYSIMFKLVLALSIIEVLFSFHIFSYLFLLNYLFR